MGTQTYTSWFFLKSVDVKAGPETGAIVAFGDSITDGAKSTVNADSTWPDILADRLHSDPATKNLAVVNEGIGGNRILHDGTGPSAEKRFDDDALNIPGVTTVILLEGINDIGHAFDPRGPSDVVSVDDLIQGFTQLATRAHARGLKVIGATLTPFVGANYQSPSGEQAREKFNDWIRTSSQFDGVIDFDKATRDPANPTVFLPAYDSGDHLHPKDAGYKAMAESIDLKLFASAPARKK
jgi:lysophospholipase L1-like esterase